MKEIWLFTPASSAQETIHQLGKLGVVEIKEVQAPTGDSLSRRTEAVDRTRQAISILEQYSEQRKSDLDRPRYPTHDPKRVVDRVLTTGEIRSTGKSRLEDLRWQENWYRTWGENTRLEDLHFLREKGLYLRLYRVDKSRVASLAKEHAIVALPEYEGKVPIVLVSRRESDRLNLKAEPLPQLPLQEVRRRIIRKERQLQEIEHYLADQAQNLEVLRDYLHWLEDRRGVQWALNGMGNIEDMVMYLRGYIPRNEADTFKEAADANNWGYKISDPEKPEDVPVYVRNPKWISIINPVMKFIDIVPGYREVDVSIYFLVAFSLFFAMLVGDAGYGAIFLLLTFIFRKKMPAAMRFLSYVLSGATMIWGVLSGTYFGSEEIAAIPVLNQLIIDDIASFGVDNINFMMHLSFLIGAIHLTIAHLIRVVQFINSIKVLSEIGWIAFIWGLFYLAENLVLGNPMPDWSMWLFLAGGVLVTLFSVESKNFFRSMAVSLGNLPLSLINGFSDIVSYVRLFAVGLATATVAASFNNMVLAAGISNMGVLEIIVAAVALLLGHGLNIALALMAVMVHGIRLNMLEFAGHLGVQFSGEAYKPFRLISENGDSEELVPAE